MQMAISCQDIEKLLNIYSKEKYKDEWDNIVIKYFNEEKYIWLL